MEKTSPSFKDIAQVFLKLGSLSFGGPAVHIAMMRTEVVEKRAWLSEREFLDLLGATNLIPGPNSTELAMFLGYKLRGVRGLFVSGACFILPAFFIVLAIAVLYQKFGTLPDTHAFLAGMRPVVFVVVLLALWKFGQTVGKTGTIPLVMIFVSAIFIYYGMSELIVLFGLGLFLSLMRTTFRHKLSLSLEIFLFFLKVGSVLFGSGYVLLGFLQKDLVAQKGLLSSSQLLDAITVGQITPGPVFTTATFIGYLIDGVSGASAATIGIFLPSFLLVFLVTPFLSRLRTNEFFSHFIDGVNAASLGLMIIVIIELAQKSFTDSLTLSLGLVSLILLLAYKNLNSAYLILLGGALGYFFL